MRFNLSPKQALLFTAVAVLIGNVHALGATNEAVSNPPTPWTDHFTFKLPSASSEGISPEQPRTADVHGDACGRGSSARSRVPAVRRQGHSPLSRVWHFSLEIRRRHLPFAH